MNRTHRLFLAGRVAAAVGIVALTSSVAWADEKSACIDAASQGQTLRDAHKLLEARDQFQVCARASCPHVIQSDCAGWLAATEKALPTVLFHAKDASGADVAIVRIVVDGRPVASSPEGSPVGLNPGRHHVRLEGAQGVIAEDDTVVREGEQNRAVTLTAHEGSSAEESSSMSPLRVAGLVVGGVGVAGLIAGIVGGALAISDKKAAHCVADVCSNTSELSKAKTMAKLADAGLIGGGVLVATGLTLFLVGGRTSTKDSARDHGPWVAPVVGIGSIGLTGGF